MRARSGPRALCTHNEFEHPSRLVSAHKRISNRALGHALPRRSDSDRSRPLDVATLAPGRLSSISAATTSSFYESPGTSIDTQYGFGFSAGGLLFPYFLGVALQLQAMNVLRPENPIAGASAGSIVAVVTKSGLGETELTEALLDLTRDCRSGGTRMRLRAVLRRVLEGALPPDIHLRCEGRAYLAVTQLWPQFEPQTISSFRSRDDLIDTVLVSCHIPYWFDGSLFTSYRDGVYFDGGITNFIPATPTRVVHRVCCFPSQQLRAVSDINLSPDTMDPGWPYDLRTMLAWAFEPAPEEMLLELIDKGKRDATAWALATMPAEQLLKV